MLVSVTTPNTPLPSGMILSGSASFRASTGPVGLLGVAWQQQMQAQNGGGGRSSKIISSKNRHLLTNAEKKKFLGEPGHCPRGRGKNLGFGVQRAKAWGTLFEVSNKNNRPTRLHLRGLKPRQKKVAGQCWWGKPAIMPRRTRGIRLTGSHVSLPEGKHGIIFGTKIAFGVQNLSVLITTYSSVLFDVPPEENGYCLA